VSQAISKRLPAFTASTAPPISREPRRFIVSAARRNKRGRSARASLANGRKRIGDRFPFVEARCGVHRAKITTDGGLVTGERRIARSKLEPFK
jgi:hypothetical protein